MRLAVDAMGGDHAPGAPVQACMEFARANPDVEIRMVGQQAVLESVWPSAAPSNISIVNAPTVITGEDEPVRAVKRKKDSSLVTAAQMVRDRQAEAMLSAGNTGALVAAGLFVIGRIQGIKRPALAPVLPTFRGHGVLLLDAGAYPDADVGNMVQFARMGSVYSRGVLGVENPRVGLVNIGTEPGKGNALTKETYRRLEESGLNFVGNVEARDILDGTCDVVVTDGFVGNVVLKTIEGMGLGLFSELKSAFMSGWQSKVAGALARPALIGLRQKFDYAEYGGAPFLGVAGGCLKAHGSSKNRAWFTALEQAKRFVGERLLDTLTEQMTLGKSEQEGY